MKYTVIIFQNQKEKCLKPEVQYHIVALLY